MQSFGITTYNNKFLLLLRDNNPAISDPNCWSLVGGNSEGDETPEETLLREFEEETSVKPTNYSFLMQEPMSEIYIYFVQLSDEEASQIKLGNEGQELKFFTLEEIENIKLTKKVEMGFKENKKLLSELLTI